MNTAITGNEFQNVDTKQKKLVFDISERPILHLRGSDALDLLHRISTNDLIKLEEGASAQTILTSEKGRFVDVLSVVRLAKDDLLLAGWSRDVSSLSSWIGKFIIMEDASIELSKTSHTQLLLVAPANQLNLKQILKSSSTDFSTIREDWGTVSWLRIIFAASQKETDHVMHQPDFSWGSPVQFEQFRIDRGIPCSPNELNDRHNPLEAGLRHLISFTKGCYVGQEVIARLDTYQKVQLKLVRFQLSTLPTTIPAPVLRDGKDVGVLTSAVESEDHGHAVGLGYISTENPESNLPYSLKNQKIDLKVRLTGKILSP